jgi:excisionase family DNA binding protein
VYLCLSSRVFAKNLGLSVKTLQRWDAAGKLPARAPGRDVRIEQQRNAKIRLAKHHAKVANLRKNTLHQITTYLCKNHAKIVEDLN